MIIIFRPVIRLFNHFNLFTKFLLFSSILVFLLVLSSCQYLASVDQSISFNKQEEIGAAFSTESKKLMMGALVYRDKVSDNTDSLSAEESQIENTLTALHALDVKYDHALDNQASGKMVSKDIERCGNLWSGVKKSPSGTNLNQLFASINALHTDISDNSKGEITRDAAESIESINIIEPGRYNLNLLRLAESDDRVIQMGADGKYRLDLYSMMRHKKKR